MNIPYTSQFTVTDSEVVIKKSGNGGSGTIPSSITVRQIIIWPSRINDAFPTYYIKGIHTASNYIPIYPDIAVHVIEGIADSASIFQYVKAATGETITMNMEVKGEV